MFIGLYSRNREGVETGGGGAIGFILAVSVFARRTIVNICDFVNLIITQELCPFEICWNQYGTCITSAIFSESLQLCNRVGLTRMKVIRESWKEM